MRCVNITIWCCQLIGIDYGNEGRMTSGPEGYYKRFSFFIESSSDNRRSVDYHNIC